MHRLLPLFLLLLVAASAAAAEFPLQDGDTWVMVGDSVTAQHLHSNYLEAFCFARYPKLTFRFRNAGVGGDTIPAALARFERDVAAWKPTVVSVELGMNDQGRFTVEQYLANLGTLTDRIRALKARPVFLTASPINNGLFLGQISGPETNNQPGNARLHRYAVALKEFAEKEKAPFADQFHPLLDVWARNKPRENLANAMMVIRIVAQLRDLDGVEHLREFLKVQEKNTNPPVSMLGDAVHPGQTGQLMMAAALLKGLNADGFVSSATLDAAGKVVNAKGCTIKDARAEDGTISFDRLDDCLPFPIADEARPVVTFDPTILELSRYELKITGLKADKHEIKVNGDVIGHAASADFAKGLNLTTAPRGPIAAQGKEILAAVAAKSEVVGQWRIASRAAHSPAGSAADKEKLDALTKDAEAADARIRAAAKPRKLRFEVAPVK